MKTKHYLLPITILCLALLVPPLFVANIVATSAGLFLINAMSKSISFQVMPSHTIEVNNKNTLHLTKSSDLAQIIPLKNGTLVITKSNGKTTTRYYKQKSSGLKI